MSTRYLIVSAIIALFAATISAQARGDEITYTSYNDVFGRIQSITNNEVVIDVECRGHITSVPWKMIMMVNFNNRCGPETRGGAGGRDLCAEKKVKMVPTWLFTKMDLSDRDFVREFIRIDDNYVYYKKRLDMNSVYKWSKDDLVITKADVVCSEDLLK